MGEKNVKEESLREEELDKKERMEKRMNLRRIGRKKIKNKRKGGDVEDRRGRKDKDNEEKDVYGIKFEGIGKKIIVNIVKRKRKMGDIVNKVMDKEVNGENRKERDEWDWKKKGEEIKKVRDWENVEVFKDIKEGIEESEKKLIKKDKDILKKDDIWRLIRDIGEDVKGDKKIGIEKWWRIVDEVKEEEESMEIGMKGMKKNGFMKRSKIGEEGEIIGKEKKWIIIEFIDID